ncbi:GNAT family N-acetyltransferase [Pseudarthrobacter sp. Y6]|uniref:GNAT family N-acetyltransferase n=1 Tax=Pseudarthrobacter sp. Y6 TaxID=3418422 RepID=UPI003CEA6CCF
MLVFKPGGHRRGSAGGGVHHPQLVQQRVAGRHGCRIAHDPHAARMRFREVESTALDRGFDGVAGLRAARPFGGDAVHLLLAPAIRPVPHFTPRLATSLIHYMFSVPGKDRIVVEPDARNTKALRRLDATCFELGPVIQLAEKEAQLAFLTRERFDRAAPLRSR